MQGLVDSLKRIGTRGDPPRAAALTAAEAIRLVHAAGGIAFLAHPFSPARERRVARPPSWRSSKQRASTASRRCIRPTPGMPGRISCALPRSTTWRYARGATSTAPSIPGQSAAGVTMSRRAVERVPRQRSLVSAALPARTREDPPRPRRGSGGFAARVALPTGLALALFVVSIVRRHHPAVRSHAPGAQEGDDPGAHQLGGEHHRGVRGRRAGGPAHAGRRPRQGAAARVRDIRYGKEGKDYFWITDMHP